MDRDEVIWLAEAIRPDLPRIAPDASSGLDTLLARLKSGESVDADVIELLTSTEALRRRFNQLLPAADDVDKGGGEFGFQELPGHGEPVEATMYACPYGDYRYPALAAGEVIPRCPNHNEPLDAC